jgi:hypothetical protein
MKQRSILITLAIATLGVVLFSCTKENTSLAELQLGKWEVEKFKMTNGSSFLKAENSYTLAFTSDSSIVVRLDKNRCEGTYHIRSDENIDFSTLPCTYLCCDTEYALDFVRLIPFMTKYSSRGNQLILEGQGQIVLKKIE